MSNNKHEFTYKIIGTPPPGLLPGEYHCEFKELKVKSTKKGNETLIVLKVTKEK
jgi:hypothetical protein